MVLGYFSVAAAAKPSAPGVPIWDMMILLGVESITMAPMGNL
jgi:hypothetical protein